MKSFHSAMLVTAFLTLSPVAARQSTPASGLFDAARLLKDLQVLSADDMQGRQVGTAGGEKARAYVVNRFTEAGIAPFGESFLHAFTFSSGRSERRGVNVIGRIAGTRDPDRYVVVTAHYDHIGAPRGTVHNGANDNASGTAALFALGSYFATHRPAHSLIFAALDGEEAGLRGAQAFLAAPPVPVSSLVANVNLDMIGRDPDDKLFASGTHWYPFLRPILERASAASSLKLIFGHDNPNQRQDWTRDSDHYVFHQAKIPYVYIGVEDFGQHHRDTDDYETMTHAFYVRAVETSLNVVKEFDAALDEIARARAAKRSPLPRPSS